MIIIHGVLITMKVRDLWIYNFEYMFIKINYKSYGK